MRTRTISLCTRILSGAALAAALSVWGCGQPAPSAPTPAPLNHVVAAPPAVGDSGLLTITWSCLTGQDRGVFSAGVCGAGRLRPSRAAFAAASVPAVPANLTVSVSGTSGTLTWRYPSGQPVNPTSFVIEAGSSPGQSDLATFDTGSAQTTLTVSGVPPGTYYVRVRAKNADGSSAASNEVVVIIQSGGCSSPPNAPTGLTGSVIGSTVSLSWNAPAGGCAPTSYGIEAGSSSGLSNLASLVTGNTVNGFSAGGVSAGDYFVRVRGVNVSGAGPASNEIGIVVGSSPPPVSPFGTFDITATRVRDTGCNFQSSFTGRVQLSGNTDGSNLTARMVERLTRIYLGTMQAGGSFSGSGSGNLDGFIYSGIISGTVSGNSISGSETMNFTSGCPGRLVQYDFTGNR